MYLLDSHQIMEFVTREMQDGDMVELWVVTQEGYVEMVECDAVVCHETTHFGVPHYIS